MSAELEHWLALASAGYHLAPVRVRRLPDGRKRLTCFTDADRTWGDIATTDPDTIGRWYAQYGAEVGFLIACRVSGLVVVDLDLKPAVEVDARTWWAREGLPVGLFRVDTPSGGEHHDWRQHKESPVPNSTGAIAPGVDVRGVGQNHGGFVIAPGTSVTGGESSERYRAVDGLLSVDELPVIPDEITERIPERRRRARDGGADRAAGGRAHQLSWVNAEVTRLADVVREMPARAEGAGFRYALMGASMMAGRLVVANGAGPGERDRAEGYLATVARTVWPELNEDDLEWIATGLDDGMADPYTITPEDDDPPTPESDPDAYQVALDREVYRERLRRDARRHLEAEDIDALEVLDSESFLDSPPAEYLIPGVLYRNSTAKLYGPPGETKSFLALDLALSLATGRTWFGSGLEPSQVHYVMAEGQAVNVGRTLAWLHHHGIDRAELVGRFVAVPQGVMLTPEGVDRYLDQVRRDQPALIVLDTKNAMMSGEENSASDVAVMVRAMRAIRDAAQGACVLLIDHTGLSDQTRGRGSNAVTAAMDTEIRVAMDRATGQASAEVTRDKDADPGEVFGYRLQSVTDVPGLQGRRRPPAVVVPVDADQVVPFGERRDWWAHQDPALVPDIVSGIRGPGSDAARDIFRVLAFMDETQEGVTAATLLRVANRRPGADYSESTARRGRRLLEGLGVVDTVGTGKYVLSGEYQSATDGV